MLTEVNSVEMIGEIDCCLRMDLAVIVFEIDTDHTIWDFLVSQFQTPQSMSTLDRYD